MIVVRINGPREQDVKKLASRVMLTLQTEGKIVRKYDDASLAPDPLPHCDVAILIEKAKP